KVDAVGGVGGFERKERDSFAIEVGVVLQADDGRDRRRAAQPYRVFRCRVFADCQVLEHECVIRMATGTRRGAGELQMQRRQTVALAHEAALPDDGSSSIESLPITGTSAACFSGPPSTNFTCVASAGV